MRRSTRAHYRESSIRHCTRILKCHQCKGRLLWTGFVQSGRASRQGSIWRRFKRRFVHAVRLHKRHRVRCEVAAPVRLTSQPRIPVNWQAADWAPTDTLNGRRKVSQNPRKGFGHSWPVCCLTLPVDGQGGLPQRLLLSVE